MLGVPVTSKTAFRELLERSGSEMEKAMLEAGKEEKRLEEQRGNFNQGKVYQPSLSLMVVG